MTQPKKESLVNSILHQKKPRLDRGQTEPGLVAFYDIRSGNGAGLFLQPRSPHGARLSRNTV